MGGSVARNLLEVDALEVLVLVDNVTDSLSTVPRDVRNETAVLRKAGSMPMSAGEYRCCAHHGLSLIITARIGRDRQTLIFDAGPEAYAISRNGELAEAGAFVVNEPEARLLLDNLFYLSGEIPRVTPYERGLPGHVRRAADGRTWEPDPWLMDERYLAVHVKNKGAVVFTACSHAGVVNVLKDARNVFGQVPLHAIMGGFHLSGEDVEPIIPDTVKDMRAFGLERIVPAHCTGWRAVNALVNTFGAEVMVPSAVGRQFMF